MSAAFPALFTHTHKSLSNNGWSEKFSARMQYHRGRHETKARVRARADIPYNLIVVCARLQYEPRAEHLRTYAHIRAQAFTVLLARAIDITLPLLVRLYQSKYADRFLFSFRRRAADCLVVHASNCKCQTQSATTSVGHISFRVRTCFDSRRLPISRVVRRPCVLVPPPTYRCQCDCDD